MRGTGLYRTAPPNPAMPALSGFLAERLGALLPRRFEISPGPGVVRIELERPSELVDGIVALSSEPQTGAQAVDRFGRTGHQPYGFAQVLDGLVHVSFRPEKLAEIRV